MALTLADVWQLETTGRAVILDERRLSNLGLTLRDLAGFLESQPFVFAVFTHDDVRRAAMALAARR